MNIFPHCNAPGKGAATLILRIMRIGSFLLLVLSLHVSAAGYSQDKITLSEKDAPLEKVFNDIEQQANVFFVFHNDLLVHAHRVTLLVKDVSLKEVLNECFKGQPLGYSQVSNTIIVYQSQEEKNDSSLQPDNDEIRGQILTEDGLPLAGVSVTVKGSDVGTMTDEKGQFVLQNIPANAVIVFSHVGFQKEEIKVGQKRNFSFKLKMAPMALGNVIVEYSTGYQKVSPERATGSFVQIDNELYNRRVSTDVLTKLDGVTSGMYFNGTGNYLNSNYNLPNVAADPNNKLGINIRGQSTLSDAVSKDPLIVVDNFPYEGDINNLSPEMVESVTVLKDAAAASIWGARAGNGVIVITTKKGRYNQRMKVSFNASVTVGDRPNVFYSKQFLNSNDFINVEDSLFTYGYFASYLTNPGFPAVSPVVALLNAAANGQVSTASAESQIDAYRNNDVRNDYEKYIYQKSVNQQYALTMRGGTDNFTYALSTEYDGVQSNLVRNGYQRFSINSNNTYSPIKNLELFGKITYSQMNAQKNNGFAWGTGGLNSGGAYINGLLPYQMLVGANGQHLNITHNLSDYYIDSLQSLGFLNWAYNPLNELAMSNNTSKQYEMLLEAGVRYRVIPGLDVEARYQNERETVDGTNNISPNSYTVRNYVDEFAQYNGTSFSYPFPNGGILNILSSVLNSDNARAQINYGATYGKSNINALAGAEIRQTTTSAYDYVTYGYNDSYGTGVTDLNYSSNYFLNPVGISLLPSPGAGLATTTNRFVSYFSNLGYTYDRKYTFSISGREDGANIFGVNTNDKITPLWSTGIAWAANRENFYHVGFLPTLNLRASYGFNGNVYNGVSYLTTSVLNNRFTGFQDAAIASPPNPDLSWEKVKNVNIGLDFGIKKNIITGTLEWYEKDGEDLIEPVPLAPSTGFTSFNGNAAKTTTKGIDLILNSTNLKGKLGWNTTLLLSTMHNKVNSYDVPQTSASIQNSSVALVGRPIFGVFSYKWAGLDPTDGDPQGYLGGKVSKDYEDIINNYSPDSLVFNGSAVPTTFGSLRNTFSYAGFSLSFNLVYKLGFVFRRPSTSIDYSDIISAPVNDYDSRWQRPGDEKVTSVPSMAYPSNIERNLFYQYSNVLIESGDFVRFQDLGLSYSFNTKKLLNRSLDHLEVYSYINNIGIIWRKNKDRIDPDFVTGLPNPRTYCIGVKTSF
jgi:TonB-dependent starch-binding outer membrane protein SusC